MLKIEDILADTLAHGFRFATENVKRDGHTFEGAQVIVVADLPKFDASFPGVALRSCNGSSTRVESQRINRSGLTRKHTKEQLQTSNIRWLLGIEQESSKVLFRGPEGIDYETEQEMQEAWLAYAEDKQTA